MVKMASAMRRILVSVGVENSVIEKFEAQDIIPDVVQTLSDTQMFELGVTTLGKRQLIRSLCRESGTGTGNGGKSSDGGSRPHYTFGMTKRIAMLDQFSTELEILDLLPAVRARPAIFESLFVASAKRISPDTVKNVFRLKPSASECTEAVTVFSMVQKYIENSSEDELKQLLKFSTGAEEQPSSGVVLLEVSRGNESIYASTCLCEIIIPQVMASLEYEDFRSALSAAVDGNSFNCV